jgi:hypothetical protein
MRARHLISCRGVARCLLAAAEAESTDELGQNSLRRRTARSRKSSAGRGRRGFNLQGRTCKSLCPTTSYGALRVNLCCARGLIVAALLELNSESWWRCHCHCHCRASVGKLGQLMRRFRLTLGRAKLGRPCTRCMVKVEGGRREQAADGLRASSVSGVTRCNERSRSPFNSLPCSSKVKRLPLCQLCAKQQQTRLDLTLHRNDNRRI